MRTAVLGTGTMGAGMARALRRDGHEVAVWNRTRARAEPLAQDGIEVFDSVATAVDGAEAVLTVLFDTESVLAVTDELVGVLGPDAVWLQTSTVGPDGIAAIAERAGTDRLLDAPVLGTKKPAEDGTLTTLVSGPDTLIEAVRPLLESVGAKTVVAGDQLGAASALKLVCNAWIGSITAGTAQSVALAGRLGLEPALFLQAIDGSAVNTPYTQLKGTAMINQDWTPSFQVDGVVKDLGLIAAAASGAGLDTALVDTVRGLFVRASERGHGADDMAAVFAAFE